MKSILISIQPKWCELIASGKKTVEVRKSKPQLKTPFKVYIYETKGKKQYFSQPLPITFYEGSGKVIGEFICDKIVEVGYSPWNHGEYICEVENIHEESCVDFEAMFDYIADGFGYALHISKLVIYDKPKELSEFNGLRKTKFGYAPYAITRPPQSWCYVEELI